MLRFFFNRFVVAATFAVCASVTSADTNALGWLAKPLTLTDAIDTALQRNAAIAKARTDLEAAAGIALQARAIVIPKIRVSGGYQITDKGAIDNIQTPGFSIPQNDQNWNLGVKLVQSIYEGGRMRSALRSAKLTREQAMQNYETIVADTLTEVRVTYFDVLLAAQQILVQEASVKLLGQELDDQKRRYEAGTVPRFNVLRAEVEVANARPKLIRSKNAHRVAKNNLANLLGYDLPPGVWEDLPLQLAGKLEAEPYALDLSSAIQQARVRRPELSTLRTAEKLRREEVIGAKAGALPSLQAFVGYGSQNSRFSTDLSREVSGWNAGAQLSWDPFDGELTKGKVDEARARLQRVEVELDDVARRVEIEVRTAYSNFIEAQEVLESQKKVQEQAEEALRLATARSEAGTGTQLEVLNAQTALTEARTTQILALRDHSVARVRLERAAGEIVFEKGLSK